MARDRENTVAIMAAIIYASRTGQKGFVQKDAIYRGIASEAEMLYETVNPTTPGGGFSADMG